MSDAEENVLAGMLIELACRGLDLIDQILMENVMDAHQKVRSLREAFNSNPIKIYFGVQRIK